MPLISILIPMRNGEPFITATLESIRAQSDVEIEIIVIDDGSTDRSPQIVRDMNDPRIRIIPGPQRGISAAFNAGLAAARGELLARCDADDLYPASRLAWQAKLLANHPEFGAVCGFLSIITATGKQVLDQQVNEPACEITEELRGGAGRSHMCAYLFRTELLRQIGGCREWFVTSEDRDLQYRLAEITRIWYEPKPAYLYRLHDQSITHSQKLAERSFYESAAKQFQDQRRGGGMDDLQRGSPPPIKVDGIATTPQSAREQIQSLLIGQAWKQHGAGMKKRAIASGWRGCVAHPTKLSAWKSLIALMMKTTHRTK